MALCVLIAVGTVVSVLKIWPSTPPWIAQEVRISFIDWLQSEGLARRAREMDQRMDGDSKYLYWRAAIGNNPGSSTLNREYLEALIEQDTDREYWSDAMRTGMWLLRLSNTNRADLELSTQALEHYELDGLLLETLSRVQDNLSPSLRKRYVETLFRLGHDDAFATAWEHSTPKVQDDPIIKLYRSAHEIVHGTKRKAKNAQQFLARARQNPETTRLATRLSLHVNHRLKNLAGFRNDLDALKEQFADTTNDHIQFWDLLVQHGFQEEALQQAHAFAGRPRTQDGVIEIADAFANVGLTGQAIRYLEHYSSDFGFHESNWHSQASFFIDNAQWDKLYRLALSIRSAEGVTESYLAYSYYLEGKAEYERDRRMAAAQAFERINRHSLHESDHGLYVGANLAKLGFDKEAHEVLVSVQAIYRNNPSYWELRFEIAGNLRLSAHLLVASENLFRLLPHNLRVKINFASILISQSVHIDRALALTFEALNKYPKSVAIRINHAHALVRCNRPKEAAIVLDSLNPATLYETYKQGYYLTWAELYHRQNQYDDALKAAEQIIPELLLPGDKSLFESLFPELNENV